MNERKAIIHIGTHKTGTTSLQLFFDANAAALQAAGVRVAQSGRYLSLPGNHQIAWELLSLNASPHFDKLVEELRSSGDRSVLISSEDLCLLYARPAALEHMRIGIALAGFTPKIVVYLRAQAPYAESMYVERIKHDYVRPLGGYLEAILRDGVYVPDGSPIHLEFEYTRLLEPFVRAFGKQNVVVRPYVPSAEPLALFRDFLAVIGSLDPSLLQGAPGLNVPQARANESLTFYSLVETAHRSCDAQRTAGLTAIDAIRSVAPDVTDSILQSRVRLLQLSEILAFRSRFADDNARLAVAFGIALHDAPDPLPPPNDSSWDLPRIQRKIFDALIDEWIRKRAAAPQRQE
jgi:hypothetical protein